MESGRNLLPKPLPGWIVLLKIYNAEEYGSVLAIVREYLENGKDLSGVRKLMEEKYGVLEPFDGR